MHKLTMAALGSLSILAACGGDPPVTSVGESTQQLGATWIEDRSPHVRIDNVTYVGGGVSEELLDDFHLSHRGTHGNAGVVYGWAENGIERGELAEYLAEDAREAGDRLHRFGRTPPIVRVAHGTSDAHFGEVILAVQLINDSLPRHWQIRMSNDTVPAPRRRRIEPEIGEILVTFAPQRSWVLSGVRCENSVGCASLWGHETGEITGANVWIDHIVASERHERLATIIHELLHTLGRGHADPYEFPYSIMGEFGYENSGFILHQLDRDALFAVYDRLRWGVRPSHIYTDLGPWEDTSDVVLGYMRLPGRLGLAFGAVHRNGLVQPIAIGPTPPMWLTDNPVLRGSATWSGRMLGFTPQTEVVAARTDMTIRLSTLKGDISFTGMERWRAGAAPGEIGTGTRWRDGDLRYPIEVTGNTFYREYHSGDVGEVAGSFYGPAHEGMGGTLRRDDLLAGFGGTR